MIQCDCNIIVVSRIQLLVNKNFFHLLFFSDLIVKKYEINNIPKCTPLWHEMFEIAPPPLVAAFFTFNMSHYLKSLKIRPAARAELQVCAVSTVTRLDLSLHNDITHFSARQDKVGLYLTYTSRCIG